MKRITVSLIAIASLFAGVNPLTAKQVPRDEEKRCPKFEAEFQERGLLPVATFSYIAWRESRCRIKAINAIWDENGNLVWALNKNKTWDSGLLQINSSHRAIVRRLCKSDLDALLTLDCNLRVARFLLDNGGLRHWGFDGEAS